MWPLRGQGSYARAWEEILLGRVRAQRASKGEKVSIRDSLLVNPGTPRHERLRAAGSLAVWACIQSPSGHCIEVPSPPSDLRHQLAWDLHSGARAPSKGFWEAADGVTCRVISPTPLSQPDLS